MPLQIIDLSTLRQRLEHTVASVARFATSTPEVDALLDSDAVVAIGVSGGKDSVACALAPYDALLAARGAAQSLATPDVRPACAVPQQAAFAF
ncbi:hypothetical protein PQR70_14380 [Paraburkholderia madseniana]|jgi:hypothetical protein|uniref:hypothetical protein n=1 Tax=Paraburkholderia madseniana TaxID=2599607 RepID=UPI0038B8D548